MVEETPKPSAAKYTASQGRYWLRSVGVGLMTAASFLMVVNSGHLPTVETLYQAALQFIVAVCSSLGITAATQPKE